MSAFDRLSPALQYQIVNALDFKALRPVQELAAGPILDGKNVVVLAPTAGGKTEAAFFPLLSQMDAADWRPVSVLYVSPIRALLNNVEPRLSRYAGLIGRRTFVWHGDVTAAKKRAFSGDPADILCTTPESLEVMLMSERVPAQRLFQGLRAVVIDEVHAFVSDDRGGHLSALLERVSRHCGRDVQRIGLSATVGNPEAILRWAAGSSQRPGEVVRAPGGRAPPQLAIDYVGSDANAAKVIAELHPGKKRLVFVDSRRGVEAMGRELRALGVDAFVTHSSLAPEERQDAERAFEQGRDCVIVATSALELGIDIGDLDHVLQVNAPRSVASFLQRMGRTGRRQGTVSNCTFLATNDEGLLLASSIVRLFRQGFVEDVRLRTRAAHLLAHQLMALTRQEHGIPASDAFAWVAHATPFQGLTAEDRSELIAHMLEQGILFDDGGRLSLGPRGEKLYGFRNFTELYAVFSTPRTLAVFWGAQEIGSVDAQFVEHAEVGKLTFTLAARSWRALSIDWKHSVLRVEPLPEGGLARWQGQPVFLDEPVCRGIREVLTLGEEDAAWSRRARAKMEEVRREHEFLGPSGLDVQPEGGGLRLWTFAGGRANSLLAALLERRLGERVTGANLALRLKEGAGKSEVALREALAGLKAEQRPNEADAIEYVSGLDSARLSKFEPCLPERLRLRYLAEALTEVGTARAALGDPQANP